MGSATHRTMRREFTFLVLIGGFNFLGFNLIQPILPGFAKSIGALDTEIGLIVAAFAFTSILSRIYFAPLADRMGRKAPLIVGLVIYAVAPMLYVFASSPLALIAVRLFHGIGMGAGTTGITAMLTDIIPHNKRGTMLGVSMSVRNIATAAGPAIAGSFVLYIGFTVSFALAIVPAMASLILFIFLAETLPKETRWKRSLSDQLSLMKNLIRSRRVLVPSIGMASQTLSYGALLGFMPLFVAGQLALSIKEATFVVGISFAGYAIASAIFRIFGGRAIDKYGRKPVPIISLFSLFGVILYLSQVSSSTEVYIAMALYGLAFASISPALTAMLVDSVKPDERSSALSVFMSVFELGLGGGAILFGYISSLYGYSTMFAITAFIPLAGAVFLLVFAKETLVRDKPSKP